MWVETKFQPLLFEGHWSPSFPEPAVLGPLSSGQRLLCRWSLMSPLPLSFSLYSAEGVADHTRA